MKKILLSTLFFIPLLVTAQTVETFDGTWTVPTGSAGAGGPAGWAIVDVNGPQKKWELGTGGSYSGDHHASLQAENVATGTTSEDWLISPALTVPANGQVSFFSKLSQTGSQGTTYRVMVKVAGSTLAEQINTANYVQAVQWTETQINPVQTDWTQKTVSLANYAGQQVYIAFVMNGDNGDNWKIDNVSVNSYCTAPTNVSTVEQTSTTATIGWVATPDVTAWDISVVLGTSGDTGSFAPTTSNPYTFTDLTPGVTYKAYMRSNCGTDNQSAIVGPYYFTQPNCSPENQCVYIFRLTDGNNDIYGDWGTNTMSVYQDDDLVSTFTYAPPTNIHDVLIPLCNGVPFSLQWTQGGWNSDEIGVQIINPEGEVIYTKPPGGFTQVTTLYQGTGECTEVTCLPPHNINVTSLGTTATVTFIGQEGANAEYYVTDDEANVPQPDAEPTGTTASNEFEIDNLNPDTEYFIYVRNVCGENNMSYWSGPASITIGTGNTLHGNIGIDGNGDGICMGNVDYVMPGIGVVVTVGDAQPIYTFTDNQGYFIVDNLQDGQDIPVSIQPLLPEVFDAIEPIVLTVNYPAEVQPAANVCLSMPEEVNSDIEVILIPVNDAQAGFQGHYAAIVQNNMPVPAYGILTLDYDNAHVAFIAADYPATPVDSNTIEVNFGTVAPFATANIGLEFHILPPPVNLGGEEIVFTANVASANTDDVPDNDSYTLTQTVVNAFDPNDITVHEGSFVHIDQADEYLHYTIRFQNTGTAPAVNIRVENELDANLDWDTFDPIAASHYYRATRHDGNQLEFMFPNIFLVDSTSNEPASHGFVTYRIKPKADIAINDVVSSTAGIYFDFNEPVITNTATTTFGVLSGAGMEEKRVSIYPNPVTDELHIALTEGLLQRIEIYDLNGRLCYTAGGQNSVSTQQLNPGLYILKVQTDTGTSSFKLIKQ